MLQTGPTVDDSEASSIATLLLGFQGGLGSLFDDLGAPEGFAGFHLSHEEQELLAADPVKYQRQSSGGSTVKRNRSTSKIAGFAPTPDFARTSFTSRSKSSKDLTNLLQDKLELLQRHIQQNELLRCRCGLLEKVRLLLCPSCILHQYLRVECSAMQQRVGVGSTCVSPPGQDVRCLLPCRWFLPGKLR